LVKFVNVLHIVFFLKSNVDDGLWNVLSDSLKELGFTNNNLELWIELNSVDVVAISWILVENVKLQKLNGFIGVLFSPFVKDDLFIFLIKFFGKLDVVKSNIFKGGCHQLVSLGFELFDWFADSTHD